MLNPEDVAKFADGTLTVVACRFPAAPPLAGSTTATCWLCGAAIEVSQRGQGFLAAAVAKAVCNPCAVAIVERTQALGRPAAIEVSDRIRDALEKGVKLTPDSTQLAAMAKDNPYPWKK
jgi:hypothetical protein